MKNILFLLLTAGILFTSCTSAKNAASMIDPKILDGTWDVNEITGLETGLDELYPNQKPHITFDVANNKISGNTGCNNFNGPYKVDGAAIDFSAPLGMTRMMCPGEGESKFIQTLPKVTGWTVRENETLRFMSGDIVVMSLTRRSK